MDPDAIPTVQPIIISIPEETSGPTPLPSVLNPNGDGVTSRQQNSLLPGSVRQDGLSQNDPSKVLQTAPNVIRSSFMQDLPNVPNNKPRTEERVSLTQRDIDFFSTLVFDDLYSV